MRTAEEAVFGAGCFWCIEAIFDSLEGVQKVESGYSGGKVENPSYEEVCSGTTGHAEVAKVFYNPELISFTTLLEVFWTSHDPTTLNRQGNDRGTQYRSAIFYLNETQKETALKSKELVEASDLYSDPVVTEISPLINYCPADNYHQDYFKNNPEQNYCAFVVRPKVEKFRKIHAGKLKS